jgi:hypothetical protein
MFNFQICEISTNESKNDARNKTCIISKEVLIKRNVPELILLTVNTWKNKNRQLIKNGRTLVSLQENSLHPKKSKIISAKNTHASNAGHLALM